MTTSALLLIGVLTAAPAVPPQGKVFLTKEEALELAFPECEVERRVVFLTEAQRKRANELAGFDVGTSVVSAYVASRDGEPAGTAWFDVHQVRTKREALMFVVDASQRIRRLEVLAFAEPLDYMPRAKWYAQFVGKKLDRELALRRSIKGVAGATLTARATTEAARRVLAFHRVVTGEPEEPGSER